MTEKSGEQTNLPFVVAIVAVATIGGNISHADPHLDMPPVLAAPPWLAVKQKKSAIAQQLQTLPLAPREAWDSGAREAALEETGWTADHAEVLMIGPTSSGSSSEKIAFVRATGLRKVGEGGGTGSEDIRVHRVKLAELPQFVADWRARGHGVDVRIAMLMAAGFIGGE